MALIPASAATLNVPSQYATISAAVSAASNGDTIVLAPGTYSGGSNMNLSLTKTLTFTSSGGAASTILDCGSNQFITGTSNISFELQGVTVENCTNSFGVINTNATAAITETFDHCVFQNNNTGSIDNGAVIGANIFSGAALVISNCTFQNNQTSDGVVQPGGVGSTVSITNTTFSNNTGLSLSGAIYSNSASGTISGCTFTNNTSYQNWFAGAVYWINGSLTITDTTFTGNSSNSGGGAMFVAAFGINTPVTLTRCTFSGNSAGSDGGGCIIMSQSSGSTSVTATDCLFLDNSSSVDGAAFAVVPGVSSNSLTLTNCSFYGNSYTGASPSGQGTISTGSSTPLVIKNSILYGDTTANEISTNHPAQSTTVSFTDIHQSGYAGSNGNIDANPMYANAGSGDLHITNASPCVQAGTATGAPSTDFDQYSWGSTVSMGAFSPIHFAFTTPPTVAVGSAFSFSATATAADNSTTITNYAGTVHFTSSDGAASLPADTTLTNGTGTFNATMGTSGSQSITAADTSTTAYTSTSAGIAVAGSATHFVVSVPTPIQSYTTNQLTVTAEDALGNVATGYTGTVHLTSTDPGFVNATGDSTLTNGVGTFNFAMKKAGTQTVTATDTVDSSITGTSNNVTVTPGPANHFTISAPSTATAGTAFNLTVTANDLYGNTVTGYSGTVHFSSTDAAATLPADSTLTNGVGTFSVKLRTAGSQTVTAIDSVTSSITGTSNSIAVSAASASHFVVSAPSSAAAGAPFDVTITAFDQYGNIATGYAGTVHFTSTDNSATLPADAILTNGTGTFSATLKTNGSQTITATDTVGSSITGTSGAIAVSSATATHFRISAPSTDTAGSDFVITVTALDPYGNPANGYTGTVHISSTDPTAFLPTNSPLANGSGTFSIRLDKAGTQSISATDIVTPSITGTSNPIAVSAASASYFAVSAPSSITVGTPFNIVVTAHDPYGNPATAYAGTIHFKSSDTRAALPANSTLTNGAGTFPVTFNTPGIQTVVATDTVRSLIVGAATVDVNANVLHTFAAGLQMISAPADYSGFTMSQIFSPTNNETVVAWNASTASYAVAPTAPADTIRPGLGYWAKFKSSTDLLDLGAHTNPATPVTINLVRGWNLIGNPFSTPVTLSTTSISTGTVDAASFAYAVANQLLSPTLYTFSAGATAYQSETQTLQPYAGYWIYAYVDCTLIVRSH
jgi:hypothetical protein